MSRRLLQSSLLILNGSGTQKGTNGKDDSDKETPSILGTQTIKPEDKAREFQNQMYLKYLKKFMDEYCEYEYQYLTPVNDIKEAYNHFLKKYKDELCKYNCVFKLKATDIPIIDNQYEYKLLTCCVFCKRKKYAGCCDQYTNKSNTKLTFLLNLKLKTMS